MKKVECTFYRPEHADTRVFQEIVEKLEADLGLICDGEASEEDIRSYAETLIANAKPLENDQRMYFLGLDDPNTMPGDARVDFFYRPTYLGTAIIMKAVMKDPTLLREHASTVQGLFMGCTGRHFQGYGYDGIKGTLETLKIFVRADCERFLSRYSGICPQFNRLYWESMSKLENPIRQMALRNEWGVSYAELAKEVLALREKNRAGK